MGDQPQQDNIDAQLGSMLRTNTTQGTVTGGSFAFTEPEMLTIIKNWRDLARSYTNSMRSADLMSRIEPPADDFASRLHAAAANQSGKSYGDYLRHNADYCTQQADLFQNALDDYLDIDHNNATEINKTTPQGPQPGI
jgi:hypothetical protein